MENDTASSIAYIRARITELESYRRQDAADAVVLFNSTAWPKVATTSEILHRLARLAGTTMLEGLYILQALEKTKNIEGDWCEFGVAHGRTSGLLGQAMFMHGLPRRLWLYDSFEGLPAPHEKDILTDDIYGMGSIEAYQGYISFPEKWVLQELHSVNPDTEWYKVVKGWINAELLAERSPATVAFAYLDMDFYQSTYDVLVHLIDRMPSGGIIVLDDYGFFSEGPRTAVSEIMREHAGAFTLRNPFSQKFALLVRT